MFKRFKTILLLISLLSVVSVGGAYATWRYANRDMTEKSAQMAIGMGDRWAPEVILPDGEDSEEQGTSHLQFVDEIVNNSKAGLNGKESVLTGAITNSGKNPYSSQGIFFDDLDHVTGGNLKFINENNVANLDFLIQTITHKQSYYVYTYQDVTTTDTARIVAYRTYVEKINGKYVAVASVKGYADVSAFYTGSNNSGTKFYGIVVNTWKQGEIPTY